MRKLLLILFLLPVGLSAQNDSLKMPRLRFDFILEGGGCYGNMGADFGILPWHAEKYANALKNYGSDGQVGIQFCFFNRVCAEAYFGQASFESRQKGVVDEIRGLYPDYYIQQHSRNGNYSNTTPSENCDLKCFRLGLSANIRVTKSKYLQPYALYAMGSTTFPGEELVFKDNYSNNWFTNYYYMRKLKSSGYVGGIRFKYFSDADTSPPSALYGHCGLKLEFVCLNADGLGEVVTTSGITGAPVINEFRLKRSFRYVVVGVFFGFGHKGKKYKDKFIFGSKKPVVY